MTNYEGIIIKEDVDGGKRLTAEIRFKSSIFLDDDTDRAMSDKAFATHVREELINSVKQAIKEEGLRLLIENEKDSPLEIPIIVDSFLPQNGFKILMHPYMEGRLYANLFNGECKEPEGVLVADWYKSLISENEDSYRRLSSE